VVDLALCRLPIADNGYRRAKQIDEEMGAGTMIAAQSRIAPPGMLRPEYTEASLSWLMETLSRETRNGVFQKKIVKTESGTVAGWYVYYLNKGGTSIVFQVTGTETTIDLVLDHLFADAERGGSFGLLGRLEPRFMKQLALKGCLFMPGRHWMLVHSRHAELLQAINNGDAFLSRLEGDMWVL
jgi:hypothetical protein